MAKSKWLEAATDRIKKVGKSTSKKTPPKKAEFKGFGGGKFGGGGASGRW